nr:WcbI family polysaccharide biosynthesis putative acetyltransferase [Roseibacterium persicicum]
MKLLVTGNCQARPLMNLMCGTGLFEPLDPIILHLADPGHSKKYEESLQEADLIVAQKTDPKFRVKVLSSENINELYSGKTVIWPNIFFSGQQPFLRYFTHRVQGRLLGPFDASHDLRIFGDWLSARKGMAGLIPRDSGDYIAAVRRLSLDSLRRREEGCGVIVSDLIEANPSVPLFFTFNHPSRFLLAKAAERLLARLSIEGAVVTEGDGEPLAAYRVPSTWMTDDLGDRYRGRAVVLKPGGGVDLGAFREFDADELRAEFFRCYDHQAAVLDPSDIRVTPSYPGFDLDGPMSR